MVNSYSPRGWFYERTGLRTAASAAGILSEVGPAAGRDAAQALGQVDCAVGADMTCASSRKWTAGRLCPRLAAPALTVARQLELGEANIAARVGFSVALGEHLAYGPALVRARLAELGGISRTVLADVPGWPRSKRSKDRARSPRWHQLTVPIPKRCGRGCSPNGGS
jgi:hypothetical protein